MAKIKIKFLLVVCDSQNVCRGFLREDGSISQDPDNEFELLMIFNKGSNASMRASQINQEHNLLPDGTPYRVAVMTVRIRG